MFIYMNISLNKIEKSDKEDFILLKLLASLWIKFWTNQLIQTAKHAQD